MKKESLKSREIAEKDYNEYMQLREERSECILRLHKIEERLKQLDNKFNRVK